jgi:hypothetical protein
MSNDDGDTPDDDGPEEDVGYGRPPKKHRWQKGQSGNPAGKKKGTKSLKTELLDLMNETVEVPIKGKNKKVRMLALVLRGLAAKAAKGNVAAADKLLALVIQAVGFDGGEKERKKLSEADELLLQRLLGEEVFAGTQTSESSAAAVPASEDGEEHF